MHTNKTLEQLTRLKLQGMANRYEAMLDIPIHQQPDAHMMLAMLAEAEASRRMIEQCGAIPAAGKASLHGSSGAGCKPGRGITSEQFIQLGDCSFIDKAENVLINGATGCGKSYLACALGRQACVRGYKTVYYEIVPWFCWRGFRFWEPLFFAECLKVVFETEATFSKILNHN